MPNPNTERPPVLVVLETVPGTFCTSRLGVESPAPRHTWNVLAPKSLHPPPSPKLDERKLPGHCKAFSFYPQSLSTLHRNLPFQKRSLALCSSFFIYMEYKALWPRKSNILKWRASSLKQSCPWDHPALSLWNTRLFDQKTEILIWRAYPMKKVCS